jgi:hypothetical protein
VKQKATFLTLHVTAGGTDHKTGIDPHGGRRGEFLTRCGGVLTGGTTGLLLVGAKILYNCTHTENIKHFE